MIEQMMGRVRTIKNGPRTIDLDIILYGDIKIDTPTLSIPHPRMHEREFVMQPLNEIL
jgi:2-amino-4-hydroxy-6-hydroxymethyldihydropteridine diphosphokinase